MHESSLERLISHGCMIFTSDHHDCAAGDHDYQELEKNTFCIPSCHFNHLGFMAPDTASQ